MGWNPLKQIAKAVHKVTDNKVVGLLTGARAAKGVAKMYPTPGTHWGQYRKDNPVSRFAYGLDKYQQKLAPGGGFLARNKPLGKIVAGRQAAANHAAMGLPAYLDYNQGGKKQAVGNAIQHAEVGASVLAGAAAGASKGSSLANAARALKGVKSAVAVAKVAADAKKAGDSSSTGTDAGSGDNSALTSILSAIGLNNIDIGKILGVGGSAVLGYKGARDLENASNRMADQLAAVGKPSFDEGKRLLALYDSGQLEPGDLLALNRARDSAIARQKQYFANAGISDSQMQVSALQAIDEAYAINFQKMRDSYFHNGITALTGGEKAIADSALARFKGDVEASKVLADGISAAMGSIGKGGSSGVSLNLGNILNSIIGLFGKGDSSADDSGGDTGIDVGDYTPGDVNDANTGLDTSGDDALSNTTSGDFSDQP